MRLGTVLKDRYQVVAKLGYGSSSTVWLCHDLIHHKHRVLKVHTNSSSFQHELRVYQHLASVDGEHPGREHIRQIEDSFVLDGPNGQHEVYVMIPLGMSLQSLQEKQKHGIFELGLVKSALVQVLPALEFLHVAGVVHTDLHSDNLLIAMIDDSIPGKVEEEEIRDPSARKQVGDLITYVSRYISGGPGPVTICDLGQARIGSEHTGIAMPIQYRAPEIILDTNWSYPVDCWSIGHLTWDFIEQKSIFPIYDAASEENNNAHHLAAMVALLGPPPLQFLKRTPDATKYWDQNGQWKGIVPVPEDMTFESLACSLTGKEKDQFLDFIRSLICWLPEDRLTADGAYFHPWLQGRFLKCGR